MSNLKSQGADDGKAHRVCYTSVGKAMYGLENGCKCGNQSPDHTHMRGEILPGVFTLDDLSLGCMYCKELIEMDSFYKNKYAGNEEPGMRPYEGVPGSRPHAGTQKGPMGFGGLAQTPEANAVTIGRKDANGSVSSATPNAVNPVYEHQSEKTLEQRVLELEECSKQMKPIMSSLMKSDDYNLTLNIPISPIFIDLAKADGQRKIAGWASVEIVDRHGELITMDAFNDDVIHNFMSRTGGRIHLQHQDVAIGEVTNIERKKMPDGTPGLWVEANLFQGESIDDAVWNGVLRGKISGFSIKGRAMERETRCNADLCYAYIPSIELYGISAVEKPANQASAISAVVDDKGHNIKLSDKSHNTILSGINMSKSLSKAKPEMKEEEAEEKVPGVPPKGAGAKPAQQHGTQAEAENPGSAPQSGQDDEGDQMVEKPQTPDAGMGMEERFKKAESAIAGLTEAMRKLAPGTQEAARTAAAMAEGLSRKDADGAEGEVVEAKKEAEGESEAVEAEAEEEVEEAVQKGPFDVPHQEPAGGIPGHQPPDFGMKKEIPAGGQYVEHPTTPKASIAEQLASVQKELAELKKSMAKQNKLPVSNSRAAPIISKTVQTEKFGKSEVPSETVKAIKKHLKGESNDYEFMKEFAGMKYE